MLLFATVMVDRRSLSGLATNATGASDNTRCATDPSAAARSDVQVHWKKFAY